ncbi:MAG: NAD(P)-dependent oxidoreductase [Pseudomonadota bacterium]
MGVFITGGHGHIGSYAAKYLAEQGKRVIIYDTNPVIPDCLAALQPHITFIRGDVMNFPHLADVCRRYRGEIDGIIHTVGIMGELVLEAPYANVQLNITGTHNVLEAARQFQIPKVVYTSTGAVYGAVPGVVAEDDYPVAPADLYGATKASCEFLGLQYGNNFGIDFRIGRVFFCYGPGKLPSTFIRLYRLVFGALEGLDNLTLDSGADQRLDFVYIADAGRGTALLYGADNPPHRIYNIATGVSHSLREVADLACAHSSFKGVSVEMGPGKLMQRCDALNIDRARSELSFTPEYTLEAGVAAYAQWIREKLGRG